MNLMINKECMGSTYVKYKAFSKDEYVCKFSIPAFFSYSTTPPMACKKNAYWPALAGGCPVSGNPFPQAAHTQAAKPSLG